MAVRNIPTAPRGNSPGVTKCRAWPKVMGKYEYVPQRLTSEVHGNRGETGGDTVTENKKPKYSEVKNNYKVRSVQSVH